MPVPWTINGCSLKNDYFIFSYFYFYLFHIFVYIQVYISMLVDPSLKPEISAYLQMIISKFTKYALLR